MFYIYPYKQGSHGAKELAGRLGAKIIKHNRSTFRGTPDRKVIVWGAAEVPRNVAESTLINQPHAIKSAANKLSAFAIMQRAKVPIPKFVSMKADAVDLFKHTDMVVCRTILNGHSGHGIVLAEAPNELVEAPLYVEYIKKKEEYRIHVMYSNKERQYIIVDRQRKARKRDAKAVNWAIRNLENGFIYQRHDVNVPKDAEKAAIEAVKALGLHFGAVDIIWNEKSNKSYVLEINTAPGLEGETAVNYAAAFERYW